MKVFILCLIFLSKTLANNPVPANISDNFYVFLTNKPPFTSPIQIDNQPADFYTHFDEKIVFEQEYEVGIKQICIDKDWKNLDEEQIIHMTSYFYDIPYENEPIILEPKNYKTIDSLIIDLNEAINSSKTYEFDEKPIFYYDEATNRVNLRTGRCVMRNNYAQTYFVECFPQLTQKLAKILGFVTDYRTILSPDNYKEFMITSQNRSKREITTYEQRDRVGFALEHERNIQLQQTQDEFKPRTFVAIQKHNMIETKYLNIYSNLINNIHDDELSVEKNLTMITVPWNRNNTIQASFKNPVFHRLNHKEIQEVLIRVKDDSNNLVSFNYNSTVWAVLEFRKY